MDKVLRGSYTLDVESEEKPEPTLEEKFEMAALAKLGGSMCYVSKKKIAWDMKDSRYDRTTTVDKDMENNYDKP